MQLVEWKGQVFVSARVCVTMSRTFWFTLCLAVLLDLCTGSPWLLFSQRTKRQACNIVVEFRCTSGECINKFSICDGKKHCADGSDETSTLCSTNSCPKYTFQCRYGACIELQMKCDGRVDCFDGSDEDSLICGSSTTTTPQVTTSEIVTSTVSSNGRCEQFQCTSGECIDQFNICDGKKHCADGSDETSTLCSTVSCPKYTFQCRYGACIELQMKCDGRVDCSDGSDEDSLICESGTSTTPQVTTSEIVTSTVLSTKRFGNGCILPEPPDHGSYTSPLCQGSNSPECQSVPGTPVARNWILDYQCRSGFELPQNFMHAVCMNKMWKPFLPTCTKLCPKLESLSVRVTCIYQGRPVNCSQPMKSGTTAKGTCNPNYHRMYQPTYSEIECQDDGRWNEQLFFCTPACGKVNHKIDVVTLISHGSPTEHGEYPWHVGLYRRNESNEWDQCCGGTLINPHLVLTAAHCVYDENTKSKIDSSEVKIGLGKYYREWTKTEVAEEKRDVREIVIPELYEGHVSSYALDIALIDLSFSVRVTNFIMPACLDWEAKFKLTPEMLGTLTGWGKTETHMPSPELLMARLPFIDRAKCRSDVPNRFQRYITPDKFCAGYKNGTGAGNGDSGSGLTFVHEDGVHRVFGIVSTSVKDEPTYATYTNVTDVGLIQWLNSEQMRLNKAHTNAAEN